MWRALHACFKLQGKLAAIYSKARASSGRLELFKMTKRAFLGKKEGTHSV